MWKRELVALLNLPSWCLVMDDRLFLTVPRGCLQFVSVVFPDHTHLLFLSQCLPMISDPNIWQYYCYVSGIAHSNTVYDSAKSVIHQ